MGSVFGRSFQVVTFGESHGPAVGVVIDAVPPGIPLDASVIQRELDRRRPGTSRFVSPRQELDQVEILSGVSQEKTLGSPIALLVRNKDARSSDYQAIRELIRPGHADYTYLKKYGLPPQSGGGRASGRETVGRVAAGAVAKALLGLHRTSIRAYTVAIGHVQANRVDTDFAETNPLRCADPDRAEEMAALVDRVRSENDSIGGVVEVVTDGVPAGLGDPVFHKLDGVLAGAMLSIGAVKGIEFGAGFAVTQMQGSEANDPISSQGFLSNNAGGILGGISTGQPIVMRLAVKPTASIAKPQKTVDIYGQDRTIEIKGRHDPCLCPRIAVVAEAMAALVLADALLQHISCSKGVP
ncbi:MAG: chorismate synthase [Desulfomonile tiedjei]|nr:chorismate synthase [Desulfomonile tiedjei]